MLEGSPGREHVEVEDPGKAVIGDEEHRAVKGRGLSVDIQAAVSPHEVDSRVAKREGGCVEDCLHLGVGKVCVDVGR